MREQLGSSVLEHGAPLQTAPLLHRWDTRLSVDCKPRCLPRSIPTQTEVFDRQSWSEGRVTKFHRTRSLVGIRPPTLLPCESHRPLQEPFLSRATLGLPCAGSSTLFGCRTLLSRTSELFPRGTTGRQPASQPSWHRATDQSLPCTTADRGIGAPDADS